MRRPRRFLAFPFGWGTHGSEFVTTARAVFGSASAAFAFRRQSRDQPLCRRAPIFESDPGPARETQNSSQLCVLAAAARPPADLTTNGREAARAGFGGAPGRRRREGVRDRLLQFATQSFVALAEFELADQLRKPFAFVGERPAGRRGLFDHGGVLLRHLVHLVDGGVDLGKAGRLLLAPAAMSETTRLISPTCSTIRSQRLAGLVDQLRRLRRPAPSRSRSAP